MTVALVELTKRANYILHKNWRKDSTFNMRATLKIRKRKLESDCSLDLNIITNFRNPMTRQPTYKVLAPLGSVRVSEIPEKSAELYDRLNAALDKLNGTIFNNDVEAIRRKFQTVIPTPKPSSARLDELRAELRRRGLGSINLS